MDDKNSISLWTFYFVEICVQRPKTQRKAGNVGDDGGGRVEGVISGKMERIFCTVLKLLLEDSVHHQESNVA